MWKKGDTIRRIADGEPYLVIHLYTRFATIIVNLTDKLSPSYPQVILQKDYDKYARDVDMECRVKKNDVQWTYNHISL